MTKTELAWAAGIVDGEGCLHISYNPPGGSNGSRSPTYVLYLKVTMTHKETVNRLHQLFNTGSVQIQKPRKKDAKKNYSIAYSWLCCTQNAANAIRRMLPYLVTKAAEAEVALEFAEIPVQRGSSYCTPLSVLRKRHSCYARMCRLKPTNKLRGIFPKKMDLPLPGKPRYKRTRNKV